MVEVGEPAPRFSLPDQDNKLRNLDEFIGRKNVVLAFYFADFSSVCTNEMCAFRDDFKRFEQLDAQVIGISVDLPFSHKAFAEKYDIKFPLLSDANREVIKLYGVVHDEIFGFKNMAKRSVFVIDKQGIIRYKWVSEQPRNMPPFEEIVEVLKKIS